MSAPQFTPGPWSLTDDGCVLSSKGSHHHVKMISPWVEGAWDGDKEALANNRLIAAAPELAEALADLMSYHDVPGPVDAPLKPLLKAGFAALAKARGES